MKTVISYARGARVVTFCFITLYLIFGLSLARAQSIPFALSFWYPTNGESFSAPANIGVHALATDSNIIETVQYFNGASSIGIVTNKSGILLTNMSQDSPFYMSWSNVPAGSYTLMAVGTDSAGMMATSSPVNITVTNPVIHPSVYIYSPANNTKFLPPANLTLYARAAESGGTVATVDFFANNVSLGVVSNSSQMVFTNVSSEPLFPFSWSNVLMGSYALKAVATDLNGISSTSSIVNITVTTNLSTPPIPFNVGFYYPTNGQVYTAPANVGLHASVTDSNLVDSVEYFTNGSFFGIVTNTGTVLFTNLTQGNPFFLDWSNVPAGSYGLMAVALDSMGNMATSAPVNITVKSPTNSPPPPVPFNVSFFYPSNGETYIAPANVGLHARVTDSNLVESVEYFDNGMPIGIVTNTGTVLFTNSTQGNPFFLDWSNVPAGNYGLMAVALDSMGNMATSALVNITVNSPTNSPPPPIPFNVGFYYPTNGEVFLTPADIGLHAWVTDSNVVETVQYFSGITSIGIVTNSSGVLLTNISEHNPFFFAWDNVPSGTYSLTAVATDSAGNMATSAPVYVVVTNPPPVRVPFAVSFFYPTNGQVFLAPANIGVHARVTDSNVVEAVQYFANGTSIGIVTNTGTVLFTNSTQGNPFFLDWSNVPAGIYTLTAVATDSTGSNATSAPETIYVFTNLPPAVSIYAPDPVAIEGTNCPNICVPATCATNYISGTNTATFLVHRNTGTNADLTVYYCIGGTASNGVDYATIPNWVTIPAGSTYALITIVPLNDNDSSYRDYDTVILKLMSSTNVPPNYIVGSPSSAGAVILEETFLPIVQSMIRSMPDSSLHLSLPATNGMNFSLQVSTDMVNWLPLCTNTVLKGSAQFVDPNGAAAPSLYYRIVPVSTPANY